VSAARAPRLAAAVIATMLAAGVLTLAPVSAPTASAAGECDPGNPTYTTEVPSALALLQAQKTWPRSTGAGVLVAVVDSGIDANNVHLKDAVVGGRDFVLDGENPEGLSDPAGHGTAIAGQIAAREFSGSGVVGLAPDVDLLSVRVYRDKDDESVRLGFGPTTARMAEGIRFAADSQAKIINVSLSDVVPTAELEEAVAYAASRGSLIVASAGNRGTATDTTDGPRYPAAYPGALAVSALDARGVVTDASIHGPHVEVAAPGVQILTTATGAGDCLYAAEEPSTSFATAYVSAAAALVAAAHPEETPAQWEYRLTATAVRNNPDTRDDEAGWGIVQPFDAINLVAGATTRGPENPDPALDNTDAALQQATVVVQPDHSESPITITREATVVVIVASLTLLGTIAIIIIFRRRRAAAAASAEDSDAAEAPPVRPGLLGS
jgi:membrane-anchored mycosin MYCP